MVYAKAAPKTQVVIESSGRSWVFPLDAEEKVQVPGSLGTTVVEIHNGTVRVLSSPCDNQTCVAAGEIHSHGQWVACLPNGVFVLIEGTGDDGQLDGATW
ncbi:NusG domain II-containing protein [Breznakiella homolactica]|uniref:NusG domain II-containing protein n=2 Tax=Breznakiella homolactica TaxID=2798577 RepID=A0A7T8BDI6_9SPIR|nr:NusG domain II-containing protein [Breznakiella homolactica]